MKNCIICGNELEKEVYCENCAVILGALYQKYNTKQIMAMFSHIIGAKITQDITNNMYSALKDQYEAKKTKEEGMLN